MTIDPVEFGRLLATLENIRAELRELKERTVWRLDRLEERVEKLEVAQPQTVSWGKWVERAILFLVAAGCGVLFGVR